MCPWRLRLRDFIYFLQLLTKTINHLIYSYLHHVHLFKVTDFAMHVLHISISFLLPVCWYPPLSSDQYDITQLSAPQVALHLAKGDVCVGQSGEHTLLWTSARLHGHA